MSRLNQFLRFCLVGAAGFLVDVGALYQLMAWGLDLYTARLGSFLAAATFTWLGNRSFTFGYNRKEGDALGPQWVQYVGAMALGGLVNYGVYASLVTWSVWLRGQPWLAVAAGTAAGLLINYSLSRRILGRVTN